VRIGIDFDNTLVGYDHLFADSARRRGWTDVPLDKGKKALRDALRTRVDGDRDWCGLQAEVYGARMAEARLFDGAAEFLRRCLNGDVAVYIVSHKARFAAADPGGVDLHAVSMDWMHSQGFFRGNCLGLNTSQVFFEASRTEKLARIAALGCTHFIDDLEEVLSAPGFPKGVKRYLIGASAATPAANEVRSFKDWQGITDDIFGRY
jgi:hypothetical protein